jgi:membrane-bound lytic murein transglycosylase D
MTRCAATAALLWCMATFSQAQPPSPGHVDDVWPVLAERFDMVECSPGDVFDRIAREHAAHAVTLRRVLRRAEPWLAFVAAEIIRRDLPGELALLPMVESGYDAFAYSRRQAAGSWQLLETTAIEHGLAVNEEYDARRDMLAATPVALDYLESLHHRFDQRWDLAVHAYNAGPTRVSRLMMAGAAGDPAPDAESLSSLPEETRAHFNRLIGLACLFSRPTEYGIELPAISMSKAISIIELEDPVDLARISSAADVDPATLIRLNAGLRHLTTPRAGPHRLVVPRDSASRVHATLERGNDAVSHPGRKTYPRPDGAADATRQVLVRLQDELLPERRYHHRVRPGENLWVLSQRYSVPASTIRRSNGLDRSGRIRPGQLVRIPPGGQSLLPHQYRIQPGDSLWSIARAHGMSVSELADLNGLFTDDLLVPGQVIAVRHDACCDQLFQALNP